MYVAKVPNRGSKPTYLLRESYRENKQVKTRTLANITKLGEAKINALAALLKQKGEISSVGSDPFTITRSLPHGHVALVLGMCKKLGIEKMIDPKPSKMLNCVIAMIVASVIEPSSKLACARGLRSETASSSLGEVLKLNLVDEDDLYSAMDYLYARQEKIEEKLAKKHLADVNLVLYDTSSAAFEGKTCPLGAIGHPKDGVKGRLQIVYGLLTTKEGIPIAIEVFKGNTGDPMTLSTQISKLKRRFGVKHITVVGDRGMLTSARIENEVKPAELDFITALRAPTIKSLVKTGYVQPSLFDQIEILEIIHPEFPGERLVCCKNPLIADERKQNREELLEATEKELESIVDATKRERRPLRGKDKIALRVGKVINRFKMEKHFIIDIGEETFTYRRNEEKIKEEARLDGIYILRTSLPATVLKKEEIVSNYKALAEVEKAFSSLNNDLDIRPIRHRTENRVKAHVFLRMLSYYVTWHLKKQLAPMLFKDDEKAGVESQASVVGPAERSTSAAKKASSKKTSTGAPVHSFETLLNDLRTIAANQIKPASSKVPPIWIITRPTPIQETAFKLLGVSEKIGYM